MLAIDQIASEAEEKGARVVTMEVTKEQAQKILLATNIGKLSLILGRPNESGRDPNRRIGERAIGRTIPEPVRPVAPPPPAPVAAAPAPPSNLAKVTIVRNGETRSDDAATQGRRLNRPHGGGATN
jgi:pilus assembly protein CpaB